MTTTFQQLDPGQGGKEQLINENFAQVPKYLGESTSDPTPTDVPHGSTYFNTTTSKLKVLRTNSTWVNVA